MSEKTKKFNHLNMSFQRKQFVLSVSLYMVGFLYNASFSSQLIACSVFSVFRTFLYTPHPFLRIDELSLCQELHAPTASGWVSHILLELRALFADGSSENRLR